jgi:8-oxo-dGTP pyrophosphatase MutT (NUDIX family)
MHNVPERGVGPQSAATTDQHAGGAILFRPHDLGWQFLLLRHADRWDLPKGLVEPGETPFEAAHRELWEETSIDPATVHWVPDFLFTHRYTFTDRSGLPNNKQLTVFLGVIHHNPEIRLTEHVAFQWFEWLPPHQIEPKNVDLVLQAVAAFGGPPTTAP